jgi:multimeric flavodoxin WrbA
LGKLGDIDFEYVFLNDYNLEFYQGCMLCFDKGEQFCPHTDDRDVLIEKLERSDGVIFASPSYDF